MSSRPGRRYHSPIRQQQADETRHRILEAARKLLLEKGYAGATVDEIAREAGVASQTIYATFRSKRGIVAGLLDRARFGPVYADLVARAKAEEDPWERLKFVAGIATQIYGSERAELDLLQGAGAVSPELAALGRELECKRYESQAPTAELLVRSGRLRPELDLTAVRDVLWALTGRDLFRALVVERGWGLKRYETWLADQLAAALLTPNRQAKRSSQR